MCSPLVGLAQDDSEIRVSPSSSYFLAFVPYQSGDYLTAMRGFQDAAKEGVRSTEGRWVDSICYHTMVGECFYHTGRLPEAMEQYDAALKLALAHRNWLLRVQFPPYIEPSSSTARSRIGWGFSKRASVIGAYPNKMLTLQGRLNNFQAIRQGGVVVRAETYQLRVQEIVRCTSLAMRRRRELMGPLSSHDPLSAQIVEAMSRRPAPANHWSQAWIDVQLGLAMAMAGKRAQAISQLKKGLLASGRFDHVLTAVALLELGNLSLENRKYKDAASFFLEATFTAAAMDQFDIMQDAFRGGALAHALTNQRVIYPPLAQAASWADSRGSVPLKIWIRLLAAENYADLSQTAAAERLLEQVDRSQRRHEMKNGEFAARFQCAIARVAFQKSNLPQGNKSQAAALALQKQASPWLFQISLVDKLATAGALSPRVAELLMDQLLREPTADDWVAQPLETLAVVSTPLSTLMERWFELALERRKPEKALEIADRIRRDRFFNTLPSGGRLLALRWVLAAPESALTPRAILQRQDILTNFPDYALAGRRSEALRQQLRLLQLVPKERKAVQQQRNLLKEWAQVCASQELKLRDIALRRQAADRVFPPLLSVKEVQDDLKVGQQVLMFFATRRALFGFALSREKLSVWQIAEPANVRQELVTLLKEMGHFASNQPLDAERLSDQSWRLSALRLMRLLTDGDKFDYFNKFDELVVVPDGVLWYAPFPALQVTREEESVSLASVVRVRYAPTMSLAIPDSRPRKPSGTLAVVAGRMFPREDDSVADEAFERLRHESKRTQRIPVRLPAPSAMVSALSDSLVVLSDFEGRPAGPYDWAPMRVDRGRQGSSLADWIALPWDSPDQIALPGFHTPTENSLRKGGDGNEMFLIVCGMMATGTRTMLISQWRTGGPIAQDLAREFVLELPHASAVDAWQRSVLLAQGSEVDAEREPRVKPAALDKPLLAKHPFFWAGYLLIDTGMAAPSD